MSNRVDVTVQSAWYWYWWRERLTSAVEEDIG
jgi:hypothetical protein